jgi:hypothetical protein
MPTPLQSNRTAADVAADDIRTGLLDLPTYANEQGQIATIGC